MKIIGRAGNDFIVQATRIELANISGCDNYNAPKLNGAIPNPQNPDYWAVGTEINVCDTFNLMFKYQQHHTQLEVAATQIEAVAKSVAEDLKKKLYPITKDGKVLVAKTVTTPTKGKKSARIDDGQGQLEFV